MITDEMRDTERDPATSGCPAAGDRLDARRRCRRRRRRRRCRRRIVKAFGDKLGELFHPRDYRGNSRAQRRASAPTALAVAVAGESRRRRGHVDGRHRRYRRRRDATHRPGPPFDRRPICSRVGVNGTPRVASRWFLPCFYSSRAGPYKPSTPSGKQAHSPSSSKTDAH